MGFSDCTKISECIPLYLDNMLSKAEYDIVEHHLAECKCCREEYTVLKTARNAVKSLPEPELPEGFHKSVMNKIRAVGKPKTTFRPYAKHLAGFAAAAAVVVLSVVSVARLDAPEQNINPDAYLTAQPSVQPAGDEKLSALDVAATTEPATAKTQAETPKVANAKTQTEKPVPSEEAVYNEAKPSQKTEPAAVGEGRKSEQPPKDVAGTFQRERMPQEAHLPSAASADEKDASGIAEGQAESDGVMAVSEQTEEPRTEAAASSAPRAGGNSLQSAAASSGGSGGAAAKRYAVFAVSVSEAETETAKEILSLYQKDANGYMVGDSFAAVLEQLSALEGYTVSKTANAEIDANYIVLNG